MTRIDADLQAQVNAQLLEQGAFTQLELLLALGRLAYGDYESWRRGELEYLDDVLMGSPQNIRVQLEHAGLYARSIHLVEQAQEFHAWSDAAEPGRLKVCRDPGLTRLISARYLPPQSVPQMDLFLDNPIAALTNGIAQALAAGQRQSAKLQVDRLYAQSPNHADLAGYDHLLSALDRLHQPLQDISGTLDFLTRTTPVAKRVLGSQWRDLMTPLWRQLSNGLHHQPFDPERPQLHRSLALAEAQDWPNTITAVINEPSWWQHSPLCLRLAQAGAMSHQRAASLQGWFALCWHHSSTAAAALDKPPFPAGSLNANWRAFQDAADSLEPDDGDGEPTLETPDFPAWLLIHEPGLATLLEAQLASSDTAGEQVYRCVHHWLQARRERRNSQEIELRRELLTMHPALFAYLKSVVG